MRWIALFVGLPALELALLVELGGWIGTPATLGLIVATGVVGAALARHQGLRALAAVQRDLAVGRLPAEAVLDGLLIGIAAALLVTPGVVTDAVGFLCLAPAFRRRLRDALVRRLERAVEERRVEIAVVRGRAPGDEPFDWPERDVTDVGEHHRHDRTLH